MLQLVVQWGYWNSIIALEIKRRFSVQRHKYFMGSGLNMGYFSGVSRKRQLHIIHLSVHFLRRPLHFFRRGSLN